MTNFRTRRYAALVLLPTVLLAAVCTRAESPGGRGDLWQFIALASKHDASKQSPPEKLEVCTAKQWTEAPRIDDKRRNCVNSNFQVTGIKSTWKTVCKGPPSMTGKGELYRDADDAYSGTIEYTSAEGNLIVSLSGKRIGECDNPR